MTRLVNVLNGFDSRVNITISNKQHIGNLVILSKNDNILIWKDNFIKLMTENDYVDEIEEWIQYILY